MSDEENMEDYMEQESRTQEDEDRNPLDLLRAADIPSENPSSPVEMDRQDLRPRATISDLVADGRQTPTRESTEQEEIVKEAKLKWQEGAEELNRLMTEVEAMRTRIKQLQKQTQKDYVAYRDALAGGYHPYAEKMAGFNPPDGDWWHDIPIDDLRLIEVEGVALKRHETIRSIAPTVRLLYEFITRGPGLQSIPVLRGVVAKSIAARLKMWFDSNQTEEKYILDITENPPISAEELFAKTLRRYQSSSKRKKQILNQALTGRLTNEQLKRARTRIELNQQCLLVRFNDLRAMTSWSLHERDTPCYEAGRRDRGKGIKVLDCIYPAGPSQDAWIWGWITEDKVIQGRRDNPPVDPANESAD